MLALAVPGDPTGADLAWGLLAGVGSGVGTAFLYRGFARGRMGVVAPGLGGRRRPAARRSSRSLTGERPSRSCGWAWSSPCPASGWSPASHPPEHDGGRQARRASSTASSPGVGFGLLFAALGQVPEGAGYWPVMGTQVVSLVAVVVAALAARRRPAPAPGRRTGGGWRPACSPPLAVVGFLLARQQGLLSVAAVLTSLYPAFTVLLATLLLGERLHRAQSVGLALCAVSVACVAAG